MPKEPPRTLRRFFLIAAVLIACAAAPAARAQTAIKAATATPAPALYHIPEAEDQSDDAGFPLWQIAVSLACLAGGIWYWRRERRAADKAESLQTIRTKLSSDPADAIHALREHARSHGTAADLTDEELCSLLESSGDIEDLDPSRLKLEDHRIVPIARRLIERGRSDAAVALVSKEPWLSAAPGIPGACAAVAEAFYGAAKLPALARLVAGRERGMVVPFARTLLERGSAEEAIQLMASLTPRTPDDAGLLAAAQLAAGRGEDARRTLDEIPAAQCGVDGWSAKFRVALALGQDGQAMSAVDRIKPLKPLKSDPEFYFALAREAETKGRIAAAQELFSLFLEADLPHKDAFARCRALRDRLEGRGAVRKPGPPPAG